MGAVWMRARAELRSRVAPTLGVALIVALGAGVSLAAAAGAARTSTAYERFSGEYRAFDLSVSTPTEGIETTIRTIEAFPEVERTTRDSLFFGTLTTADGRTRAFPEVFLVADHAPSFPTAFKILRGRTPRPDDATEASVNYAFAEQLGLEVGDLVRFEMRAQDETQNVQEVSFRITAITAALAQFETSTGAGFPATIRATPSFMARWEMFARGPNVRDDLKVLLRNGERDVAAFERHLEAAMIPTDGPPMRASSFTRGVRDLDRVPTISLWLLCAFAALTTLVVTAQILAREVAVASVDGLALRSLGLSRVQFSGVAAFRGVIVGALGAVGASVTAFAASPLTPVGLARIAEPAPGFLFAPAVTVVGAAASLALCVLAGWLGGLRATRRSRGNVTRVSVTAAMLARTSRSPAMQCGVRIALAPGAGTRAIPTRSAIGGVALTVTAIAAALVFSSSLGTLVARPELSGYSYDVGLVINAFGPDAMRQAIDRSIAKVRAHDPRSEVWRGSIFASVSVDGRRVSAPVSEGPGPSIINGRVPAGNAEIVLDPRTLRDLDKGIGDRVAVQLAAVERPAAPADMRVVGTFAVPKTPFVGENPGQGAWFSPGAYERLSSVGLADTVFVKLPNGADFERAVAELRAIMGEDLFTVVRREHSATVGNLARIDAIPVALALAMSLLGAGTLVHALATTIGRRRRELGILKSIGFVSRQVRATVAWQATTLVVLALAVGLPVGVAAGRWLWRSFAEALQVVPAPQAPWRAMVILAAAAIVATNVIAALPARAAARTSASVVLREE